MTSEFSIWMRADGVHFGERRTSRRRHAPLVRGCDGLAARAHAKTCGSSSATSRVLRRALLCVGAVAVVVGLVPEIPGEDAVVVGEGCDDALRRRLRGADTARGLRERARRGLCTQPELWTPGMGGCCGPSLGLGSQQESKSTKMRADVVLRGDGEKGVDALLEAFGILLPKLVVEEDAHGVHADGLRPAQLLVDLLRVKGIGLPHFQLVDGAAVDVVAADEPWLLRHTSRLPFVRTSGGRTFEWKSFGWRRAGPEKRGVTRQGVSSRRAFLLELEKILREIDYNRQRNG